MAVDTRRHTINLTDYRWPAEWERHSATWTAWPVNAETWPGIFDRIPAAFAKFVAAMAAFEPVCILVAGDTAESAKVLTDRACEQAGAVHDVSFFDIPINDSWCRDYGPIFLNRRSADTDGPPQLIVDWNYNAWGGKYPPWDADAAAAAQIAGRLGIPSVRPNVILEGGAVDGNGSGTVLTTESCLLNPNRNPGMQRADLEALLGKYFQAESIVWLNGSGIVGDDTDGHIDQLARFTDRQTVLVASPFDQDAPEAQDLRSCFERLSESENAGGQQLQPIELQMPAPAFQQGHRLPASYCNFHIVNGGVIVPTFNDPADDNALQIIQNAFPDRKIAGISAVDLVWGLGAFHCLTQQQPAPPDNPAGA